MEADFKAYRNPEWEAQWQKQSGCQGSTPSDQSYVRIQGQSSVSPIFLGYPLYLLFF